MATLLIKLDIGLDRVVGCDNIEVGKVDIINQLKTKMTKEQKQKMIDIYGPDYEEIDIPTILRNEEEKRSAKGAEIEEWSTEIARSVRL